MLDINKLKDKIKSIIYPNGKGAINASDHQALLLDMADGMAETDTKLTELEGLRGELFKLNGYELRIQRDGSYGPKPLPFVISKGSVIKCSDGCIFYGLDKVAVNVAANIDYETLVDLVYFNHRGLTTECVVIIKSKVDRLEDNIMTTDEKISLVKESVSLNTESIEAVYPFITISPTDVVLDKYIGTDHIEHSASGYKYSRYECDGCSHIKVSSNVSGFSVAFCTFFDKDDNYISYYLAGTTYYTNEIVDVPFGASYVLVSGINDVKSLDNVTLAEVKPKTLIGYDSTSFFKRETTNLFNLDAPGNAIGYWSNYGVLSGTSDGSIYRHSHLIRLNKGKSYVFTRDGNYGVNAAKLYCFDSKGNACGKLNGVVSADNNYITITSLDRDLYVSVNYTIQTAKTFMFLEGEVFPKVVIPHYEHVTIPSIERNSVLTGRSLITYGDSIMNASAAGEKRGWGDLISARNNMSYINRAVGGRRLRREKGKLSILDDIIPSTEIQNYDYIIFQGGVNDGGVSGSWTKPTTGAIDYPGMNSLDLGTTYGALEYLCKWCMINLSSKKFGFIVTYLGCGAGWNEVADNLVGICKKYGMPYIDLRECAGFNLYDEEIRSVYGADTEVGDYDVNASYSIDDKIRYNGVLYKSNFNIPAPAGAFDESKWTNIGAGDSWHCNALAYEKSSHAIEAWLKTL